MLKQPVVVVGEEEEWSGAVAVTKTYNEYKKTNLKTDCEDISSKKKNLSPNIILAVKTGYYF